MKGEYAYIIDEVIDTQRTRELVRILLPHMISWAQAGYTDKTYKSLNNILGYSNFRGIGRVLGRIDDVIVRLRHDSGKSGIPILNALIKNANTGLPAGGFSYVCDGYNTMPPQAQHDIVDGINKRAIEYRHWDWVLDALGLEPVSPVVTEEELKIGSKTLYGRGGEGAEHKALKEYIKSHPEAIGFYDVLSAEVEYDLPSGDRLDVFFVLKDQTQIVIEVKPSSSPEGDVMRGIFQCVKYEATLKAMRKLRNRGYDIRTVLVVGAPLTSVNQKIADALGVKYKFVEAR